MARAKLYETAPWMTFVTATLPKHLCGQPHHNMPFGPFEWRRDFNEYMNLTVGYRRWLEVPEYYPDGYSSGYGYVDDFVVPSDDPTAARHGKIGNKIIKGRIRPAWRVLVEKESDLVKIKIDDSRWNDSKIKGQGNGYLSKAMITYYRDLASGLFPWESLP